MSSLVLLEHDSRRIRPASLAAITLARELAEAGGGPYDLLLLGNDLHPLAGAVSSYGARAVLLAEDVALAEPLADRYAAVVAQAARARDAGTILAASSTFSKDILPRVAGLLDAGMLTDVIRVLPGEGSLRFQRPVYAGNAIATVELLGSPRVFTCRATAFPAPEPAGEASPVERLAIDPASLPAGMEFVAREQRPAGRPELTEARVVVTGGRPFGDRETFLRLVGGLADALGGAVGATRAAVDAGIAPNDWQVGQTGKIVAPELYVACGVSGAIQHLAGMKDSRVIVAINKDPEAPIFQVATYGLVADVYQTLPALTAAIRALKRGDGG
jgi:electron transfer flavoprotein alpha subunit